MVMRLCNLVTRVYSFVMGYVLFLLLSTILSVRVEP